MYFFHFFQKYFADEKPTWSSGSGNINVDQSVAQYTGGLVKIDKDLSNASLGPTPMPELAHLSIGNLIFFKSTTTINFCTSFFPPKQ